MPDNTSQEIAVKAASGIETLVVDFTDYLRSGETLTGTPTVVEVTTSALTIDNKAVNSAAITKDGRTVAIGKGVVFRVQGGTAGTTYTIRVTVGTSATPARTKVWNVRLAITAD